MKVILQFNFLENVTENFVIYVDIGLSEATSIFSYNDGECGKQKRRGRGSYSPYDGLKKIFFILVV